MIKVAQGLLEQEELEQVKEAFDYGYFGHAQKVEQFEEEIARVCQVEPDMVAAVNNGTNAIFLSLLAAGIGPGDEVIVPSMTFVATFQAVSMTGAVPVACDVYANDLLINIEDAAAHITPRTRAIIPVHYCGNLCNMDRLLALGQSKNIRIIEDAAHCFGGAYQGRPVGSYSDIACFSFDSIKVISCGEGGAIVSHDKELIRRIKLQRLLSMDKQLHPLAPNGVRMDYEVAMHGQRCHMSNINAAIGLAQIRKLDSFIARRREICRRYKAGMGALRELQFLDIRYDEIVPFMFIVKVKNGKRDALKAFLREHDIESAIKYVPSHLFALYRSERTACPVTEQAFAEILELPLHCRLTDEDVEKVIRTVNAFWEHSERSE